MERRQMHEVLTKNIIRGFVSDISDEGAAILITGLEELGDDAVMLIEAVRELVELVRESRKGGEALTLKILSERRSAVLR